MDTQAKQNIAGKQGAQDSGRYFNYMQGFVDFTPADTEAIQKTKPIIEKHLAELVTKFYSHLLRHPPTRKFFLKKDGSIDQPYVELRMRHLTNFWLRTVDGNFDDEYARYLDYVGRAHTSRGADPNIYIAERYVIGQVSYMQHAIASAISQELRTVDRNEEVRAIEAWDKLMMVLLEMFSRSYGGELESETFEAMQPIDQTAVERLADEAFEHEHGTQTSPAKDMLVAGAGDIQDGEHCIVHISDLSIGVFHHKGKWYALRNLCLHRGGPVCTGTLEGDTLTCPWHGFQYDITDGHLLVDPNAKLDTYPIEVREGEIHLLLPAKALGLETKPRLENEFSINDVGLGKSRLLRVGEENVAVFNVDGKFFATQEECTHAGGPLSEGALEDKVVTCPMHGSRFDVTSGEVVRGPAQRPLKTYKVEIQAGIGRVVKSS